MSFIFRFYTFTVFAGQVCRDPVYRPTTLSQHCMLLCALLLRVSVPPMRRPSIRSNGRSICSMVCGLGPCSSQASLQASGETCVHVCPGLDVTASLSGHSLCLHAGSGFCVDKPHPSSMTPIFGTFHFWMMNWNHATTKLLITKKLYFCCSC